MGQVVSISDHKKKKRRTGGFKWLRIILLCLICALIGFGISQSALFNVKNINVSGNQNVESALIQELSGIEQGQHIYSFNAGRAETMISTNPWIESVKVTRQIPNTVNIKVVERQAVAAVAADDGVLIIDKTGVVLKKQALFDGLPYMLIIGVDDLFDSSQDEVAAEELEQSKLDSDSQNNSSEKDEQQITEEESVNLEESEESIENDELEANDTDATNEKEDETVIADQKAYDAIQQYDNIVCGEVLKSAKLNSGLKIAMEMEEDELNIITQINVLDPQNIIMDTVYGIKIYFGDDNNVKEKFDVTNTVFEEENSVGHMTKIQYIDVSVPSHPALKYNN